MRTDFSEWYTTVSQTVATVVTVTLFLTIPGFKVQKPITAEVLRMQRMLHTLIVIDSVSLWRDMKKINRSWKGQYLKRLKILFIDNFKIMTSKYRSSEHFLLNESSRTFDKYWLPAYYFRDLELFTRVNEFIKWAKLDTPQAQLRFWLFFFYCCNVSETSQRY